VKDGKYRNLSEPRTPRVPAPAQDYQAEATLVARTGGEPFAALQAVRRPCGPGSRDALYDVKSLDHLVAGRTLLFPRLAAACRASSRPRPGLAMVGLSGVVAYSVARREREIGIRMSLGATPRRSCA